MSDIGEKAVAYHGKGYNCAQSVLCSCAGYTRLDDKTAAAIGYGFAGGMYCGEVCGAVTGGLMAIGAAALPGDDPAGTRNEAVKVSTEFEKSFKEKFGTILCREILAKNGRRVCDECIACGAENAEKIIEKINEENTKNGDL